MATLASYITVTQRLLHDSAFKYYTKPDLIDAVNQAQRRAVADSACLRSLKSITLDTGREVYDVGSVHSVTVVNGGSSYGINPTTVVFSAPPAGGVTATGTAVIAGGKVTAITITNYGLGYTSAPTVAANSTGATLATLTANIIDPAIMDVMNITALWGTQRITLDTLPFTKFQAYMRSWQVMGQPRVQSKYGQSTWYIGPVPDQPYQSEWDTVIVPGDLVNDSDQSPIGYLYSDTVPYYAAHIAKFKEQSLNEADFWLTLYQRKMQHAIKAAMMRRLPSVYGS